MGISRRAERGIARTKDLQLDESANFDFLTPYLVHDGVQKSQHIAGQKLKFPNFKKSESLIDDIVVLVKNSP